MSGAPDFKPVREPDRTDAEGRLDFRVAVLATDGRCLVHDDFVGCDGPLQAHHTVPRQYLRRLGLPEWSADVGMAVCYRGHRRHHNRVEPIPFDRLPARCVEFATANGLLRVLEKAYPREP